MTTTPVALPPTPLPGRLLGPAVALTVGLLYALTRGSGSPGLLTALAGGIGLGFLPGLALSLWVENRFGWWSSGVLPLVLSPALATGAALILIASGFPVEAAAGWIVLIAVLAVVLAPPPPREIEDWTISVDVPRFLQDRFDRQGVLALATLLLILLAVPLWDGNWMLRVGDAAAHAAAAREIFRGVPPTDPFLAGEPLAAFWAFDVYLAVLQGATRMQVPDLLAGGSWIAAVALVFTAYRILDLLAVSHLGSLTGVVVLFLGWNGLSWLQRLVTGETLLLPVGAGASALSPVALPPDAGFFLEPFVGAGPLELALIYQGLFLGATQASLGERRPHWNFLAAVAAAGMLLFHPGLALFVIGVTLAAIPAIWIRARLNPLRGEGREVTGVLLAVVLALLVTAPYLRALVPAEATVSGMLSVPAAQPGSLVRMLLPVLLLGIPVAVRFLGVREVRRRAWGVWSLMAVAAVFLVGPRDTGLAVPALAAYLPLALLSGSLLAGGGWSRRGVRVVGAVIALVLLLPGTLLGLGSYTRALDPGPLAPDRAHAAEWIDRHLPPDAVLVGADPALALASRRRVLALEDPGWAHRRLGAPGLPRWRDTARALVEGMPLSPRQARDLERIGSPVYVVRETGTGVTGDVLFRNEALVVVRSDLGTGSP